ncbi:alpha/beta-hydrolase [Thozetella sp. PMI_491]|nr:alpha/beta-hydrolase [Thozetella sp. PMI_491]
MDRSHSSTTSGAPQPYRKNRDRDRERDRDLPPAPSRRSNNPADVTRDRDYDVFRDRAERDQYRHISRFLNSERSKSRERERERERDRAAPIPPASPEIISSLITSLAVISNPEFESFDRAGSRSPQNQSVPSSPTGGSFGVDYGAFNQPSLAKLREETALDELAASAPVIRTAKPPSGFSALTAPKSPSRNDSSGLKSLLSRGSNSAVNVSRPSSRGSAVSVAESIGNVSIERGVAASPGEDKKLKRQKSLDSWGKKTGRSQRGLMYMSSKERLRDNEDKKRASIGAVGGSSTGLSSGSGSMTLRPDPFLAETTINEEPSADSAGHDASPNGHSPRVPLRDSSLRKTGTNAKRSSARSSRHARKESENPIKEADENPSEPRQRDSARRRHQTSKQDGQAEHKLSVSVPQRAKSASFSKPAPDVYNLTTTTVMITNNDLDDGAPSPAVAQGRRRERDSSTEGLGRRRPARQVSESGYHSGYHSEGGGGMGDRIKRSGSKLKRLSGAHSPNPDRMSDHGASRRNSQTDQPHIAYERPQSADSIDDAVESYLCSPRLSQKIRHPQTGRVISFSEVGDPSGSAVFCCVGMGLTRYITAFYDELALTLKLRLITPDRPGVGDSESYADGTATPLGWPDDVYAICQSLKITKFSIIAHSAGAIYALATALRMPQHIRGRIHLLAPWIPPSQMSVFGASAQTPLPPTNAIPTSQRILRALPTPLLKAANSSFMTATSSSITSSLPKQKRSRRDRKSNQGKDGAKAPSPVPVDNKENLAHTHSDMPSLSPGDLKMNATENMDRIRPTGTKTPAGIGAQPGHRHHRSNSSQAGRRHSDNDAILSAASALADSAIADRERQETYDERLTHAIWQLATTGANPAVDLLVCLERRHTIGFRYVDITRPVIIHHGSRDTRVPVENVRWLGKTMRRCEVRVLEGEGHGLMASAQVMGGVLMEVSREWEEWGRVTGATRRERERKGTIGQAR